MRIEPITEATLERAFTVVRAAMELDVPDLPPAERAVFFAAFHHPFPGALQERYLASDDDVPVGFLGINLPRYDNLDNVHLDLIVHPQHRRRGVGRALYDHTVARARALGRKRLIATTEGPSPDGPAFADAMGAAVALRETRSRFDVAHADEEALDAMRAQAWRHADGYRIVQWIGIPPDELLDDLAYLDGRLLEDAPVGDLAVEAEQVDGARVRGTEEARQGRGLTAFHTGAVHTGSGRLVAWSALTGTQEAPWHAWQQITIVHPEHRGHRLGLIVKLENLRHIRAARPGLAAIDTINASANERMLAINREMGFRPVDAQVQWQLTL
ncbi:N-acetyltransferase family protein [Krasilnikovia sp. MM14-A1259]|uniref:GNAT family N-acetyltransferase n=1 Tax=Krasilnikovia sp. MM14-A1259 TaxID=3373539 RepID=UPI003826D16B